MGLKTFLSSVFSKPKPIEEEIVEEVQEEVPETDVPQKRNCEYPCELCNKIIGPDRYKKLQGHWFHKKCFKKQQKKVLNGGGL